MKPARSGCEERICLRRDRLRIRLRLGRVILICKAWFIIGQYALRGNLMSKLFYWIFLLCTIAVGARADELSPREYQDIYKSQYGHFSHWSAVLKRGKNDLEIIYAVCNLHENTPLIYKWVGPNITVGEGGRLPVGKCHTLSRGHIVEVEHEMDAHILFTQAARRYDAPAHLSKLNLPIPSELLPRVLESKLRTFYGPGMTDAPNLADLVITQKRGDGTIHHSLSWYPRKITIAITTEAFGDEDPNTIAERINESGYEARVAALGTVIANSEWLSRGRADTNVVVLNKTENSPERLEFDVKSSAESLQNSHITVIDRETKALVTDVEITTFAPKG